jgi:hypothetical protein
MDVQIKKLRSVYGALETIDPGSIAYKQLIKFLDRQSVDTLRLLAMAKIKFVSPLARNRVARALA